MFWRAQKLASAPGRSATTFVNNGTTPVELVQFVLKLAVKVSGSGNLKKGTARCPLLLLQDIQKENRTPASG